MHKFDWLKPRLNLTKYEGRHQALNIARLKENLVGIETYSSQLNLAFCRNILLNGKIIVNIKKDITNIEKHL